MTTLYAEIDKTRIASLPQVLFKGRIVVVETLESARKAVEYLSKEELLGIDTETRPSFRKGTMYKVALLQVSTHDICFLFRLNKIGLPEVLKTMLGNDQQLKVGLSLNDDIHALCGRSSFHKGKYLDLQKYVTRFGIVDKSLQKLYANIFSQRISKGQRLTNWEASALTPAQQRYAATDAWACIKIYERLQQLYETQDFLFVPIVSENVLLEKVVSETLHTQIPLGAVQR